MIASEITRLALAVVSALTVGIFSAQPAKPAEIKADVTHS
jgi:hypothetical protein